MITLGITWAKTRERKDIMPSILDQIVEQRDKLRRTDVVFINGYPPNYLAYLGGDAFASAQKEIRSLNPDEVATTMITPNMTYRANIRFRKSRLLPLGTILVVPDPIMTEADEMEVRVGKAIDDQI